MTNIQILGEMKEGNHSNFEKLDSVLRDLAATKYMETFNNEYKVQLQNGNTDAAVNDIVDDLQRKKALFNPVMRLGLSQMANFREHENRENDNVYRKIDNEIARRIMEQTLTHQTTEEEAQRLKNKMYQQNPKMSKEQCDADVNTRIAINKAKQGQMAKQLLMMHIGKLKIITKVNNQEVGTPPTQLMASILAHCSRTLISTPKLYNGDAPQLEETMWDSILKHHRDDGYVNEAQIFKRGGSTHSFDRRGVTGFAKEKKIRPTNLFGQTGMNVAIGGLGAEGVDGRIIDNDGTCGHVYGMHKNSTSTEQGGYLFGYESDAYGYTNQLGHTNDLFATGEYASSFGCQRTDEVGMKYGGRQANINFAMKALTGKIMGEEEISRFVDLFGVSAAEKTELLNSIRNN